ncbi:uncharacterized protein LOC127256028 isoform X2 [Andrographis paniculata]|uniref:uncharacterized protein LOC127256028 isoform X2 n=1 Tax=Andrographis paniculata TaxID=175694 RepID=UPI0021E99F5F|nr:uncharacterized protein LOC127256028 isoform X2 [Andrographis paniculata]
MASTPPPPAEWEGDSSSNTVIRKDVLNASPRSLGFTDSDTAEHLNIIYDRTSGSWNEHVLESSGVFNSNVLTTHKSSVELMEEIAVLEVEIMHLEQYLLSLYRTAFMRYLPTTRLRTAQETDAMSYQASSGPHSPKSKSATPRDSKSPMDLVPVSVPLSSPIKKQPATNRHNSLAEHLGHSEIDNLVVRPDKLSEDIVRCVSLIYCKLANPATHDSVNKGCSASSASSFCSSSTFSPKNLSGRWSPQYSEDVTANCDFEGLKQENGHSAAAAVLEVLKICLDDENYSYATSMLKKFRSLVKSLETVDPMKMKREQSLAFWINIHNALLMHAYLAYGTQNYIKSNFMVKAAYNVGGHCVNAYDIQSSILGIRSHYSATTLVSPGRKFKTGNTKHPYAIDYPEPLVHFALCSGAYWDPMVRIYTAKSVFEDLEIARAEFIRSTVYFEKETRICAPKILCHYGKDLSLGVAALLEVISEYVPDVRSKAAIKACVKSGRASKHVHWLEQSSSSSSSSSFRYLIHKKIANDQTLGR